MIQNRRLPFAAACLVALLSSGIARAASDSDRVMAWVLDGLARREFATPAENGAQVMHMAALYEAAWRCDPREPLIAANLADCLKAAGEVDRAIEIYGEVRKLRPGDHRTQVKVIELHLSRMQTVDKKLEYARQVAGVDAVPAEVRSVAAQLAAGFLLERGDSAGAMEMAGRAIALNPLNVAALNLRFQLAAPSAAPAERLSMVLDLLRANPAQPQGVLEVARSVAAAGLTTEAADWYARAAGAGALADRDDYVEFAAALFLSGKPEEAAKLADAILAEEPDNYSALVLRWLVHQRKGEGEAAVKARGEARNALLNSLVMVREKLGYKPPTSRPFTQGDEPLPDLRGDMEAFKKAVDVQPAYLRLLGDLAWFEAYARGDAATAEKVLTVLGDFSKEAAEENRTSELFTTRMEGWIFLLRNKPAEAKVKLEAAAAKGDAWAKLGMVRVLEATDKAKAAEAAKNLLSDYNQGLFGAMMSEAVRPLGATIEPAPHAEAVRGLLGKFPAELLTINAKARSFYIVRHEPMRISVPYGQPLLARVTIQNTSHFDLTIGEDGVIKPVVMFDAQIGGLERTMLPLVAIEPIPERLVLKTGTSLSFIVRYDQPKLAGYLATRPLQAVGMVIAARTNGFVVPGQGIGIGPAGSYDELRPMMERAPFALSPDSIKDLMARMQAADRPDRLRLLDLGLAVSSTIASAPRESVPAEIAGSVAGYPDLLRRLSFDADPNVAARAGYLRLMLERSGGQDVSTRLKSEMLNSKAWQSRLWGLILIHDGRVAGAAILPEDKERALLEPLKNDPDLAIRYYARGSLLWLDEMKARREKPATRPATGPAAGGVAPAPAR